MIAIFWLIYVGIIVLIIASMWKVYEKAGHPGWSALIPIYNLYIMLKIANKPGWWILLMCIPLVNIIFAIIVSIDIAKAFGKDVGFGLGLAFLGFIFYPILAFGDAKYVYFQENEIDHIGRPVINVADELHKLDDLFKRGVITFEEFEKRKAKLLN